MVTLEEYKEVAPLVMSTGDFTLTAIENKLASVPTAEPPAPIPEPTKAQVIELFNAVFAYPDPTAGVAANGGFGALALETGLKPSQVKALVRQMADMLALYRAE